jgi:hypothetical protein
MNIFRKNKEKIPEIGDTGTNMQEPQENNSRRFFDKIAFFRMNDDMKSEIADEILSETYT